jgi:hypothetical protein
MGEIKYEKNSYSNSAVPVSGSGCPAVAGRLAGGDV